MIYYLFDFDGTLCNTNEGVLKSVEYALNEMGVKNTLTFDEMAPMFIGPPLTESFPYFFGDDRGKVMEAIIHFRDRYNRVGIDEHELFDGVVKMLEQLKKRGRKMYICSSKPRVFLTEILKQYNIKHYFESVYAPMLDEDKITKTDLINMAKAEILEKDALPEIYMIGDRKYDVLGAHAAGIECIGVRWGSSEPGEFEACNTEYTVSSTKELLTLDKTLAKRSK